MTPNPKKLPKFVERAKELHESKPYPMSSDGTEYSLIVPKLIKLVEIQAEMIGKMKKKFKMVDEALQVPAAEYVPAISDAWAIIDKTLDEQERLEKEVDYL